MFSNVYVKARVPVDISTSHQKGNWFRNLFPVNSTIKNVASIVSHPYRSMIFESLDLSIAQCLPFTENCNAGWKRSLKLLVHQLFQFALLGFFFGNDGSHNGILTFDHTTLGKPFDNGICGGLGPVQLFLAELRQIHTYK